MLILRATDGLLNADLLLPGDVLDRMLRKIPKPQWANVPGANHYGIIFQPHLIRDQAILKFLGETGSVTAL